MTSPKPPRRDRTLIEALVALAARDGLGETVDWLDVRAAIFDLLADPVGPRDLRAVVGRLNDPSVASTLEDWFIRAAAEREEDARSAARAADLLLTPLQRVGLGGLATAVIGAALGTVSAPVAAPVAAAALAVSGAATFGRWRLSRREDEAKVDANAIRRMAEIAHLVRNSK